MGCCQSSRAHSLQDDSASRPAKRRKCENGSAAAATPEAGSDEVAQAPLPATLEASTDPSGSTAASAGARGMARPSSAEQRMLASVEPPARATAEVAGKVATASDSHQQPAASAQQPLQPLQPLQPVQLSQQAAQQQRQQLQPQSLPPLQPLQRQPLPQQSSSMEPHKQHSDSGVDNQLQQNTLSSSGAESSRNKQQRVSAPSDRGAPSPLDIAAADAPPATGWNSSDGFGGLQVAKTATSPPPFAADEPEGASNPVASLQDLLIVDAPHAAEQERTAVALQMFPETEKEEAVVDAAPAAPTQVAAVPESAHQAPEAQQQQQQQQQQKEKDQQEPREQQERRLEQFTATEAPLVAVQEKVEVGVASQPASDEKTSLPSKPPPSRLPAGRRSRDKVGREDKTLPPIAQLGTEQDSTRPDASEATEPVKQSTGGGTARTRATTAPAPAVKARAHRADRAMPELDGMSSRPISVVDDDQQSKASEAPPLSGDHAGGEAWTRFQERSSRLMPADASATALFETFRTSADLGTIYASFAQLFHRAQLFHGGAGTSSSSSASPAVGASATLPPWAPEGTPGRAWEFPYERIRVWLGGYWKAKDLWAKLDERRARRDLVDLTCVGARLKQRRAVVVGSGPAGLYIAIHLRLLGVEVTVVERRVSFTRINQLHLWHWCGEEIKALGARSMKPPPDDFGSNPDLLSIGISDLQTLLFKTALLLGAEVLFGVDFKSAEWHAGSSSWRVHLETRPHNGPAEEAVSPHAPQFLSGVGVLIGTDGAESTVGKSFGIEAVELGNLRAEGAIGLVCNFTRMEKEDKRLRSFALASVYYGHLFQQLLDQTGCELENIVYTKSTGSHYFVTTPTRRSLSQTGVLRDINSKPLLAPSNVDKGALDTFIRGFVSFPFKADQPTLSQALEAGNKDGLQYADKGPQLFDFSKLRRAKPGLLFAEPPKQHGSTASEEGKLLVALAGDALLEPFWPEGLGIVRGFLSALDVTFAVAKWDSGLPSSQVEQLFAEAFTQLKSLGARTRGSILRDDDKLFALPPSTRYRGVKSVA